MEIPSSQSGVRRRSRTALAAGSTWAVYAALLIFVAFGAAGVGINVFPIVGPSALAAAIVGGWLLVRPWDGRAADVATVLGLTAIVFVLYAIARSTPDFAATYLLLLATASIAAALSAAAAWRTVPPGESPSTANELRRALSGAPLGLLAIGSLVGAGPFLSLVLVVLVGALLYRIVSAAFAGGFLVMAGLSTGATYVSSLLVGCGGGPAAVDGDGTIVRCLGEPSPFFVLAASVCALIAVAGAALIMLAVVHRFRVKSAP